MTKETQTEIKRAIAALEDRTAGEESAIRIRALRMAAGELWRLLPEAGIPRDERETRVRSNAGGCGIKSRKKRLTRKSAALQ